MKLLGEIFRFAVPSGHDSDPTPRNPMAEAVAACRTHFRYALIFSALINIGYLAPTLYMLQVYDRVVASGSVTTLLFLTVILAVTLATISMLDGTRQRLLLTASIQLDKLFSSRVFQSALRRSGPRAQVAQFTRDFDTVRATATGPAAVALFDAPWLPIYVIVCFVVHPAIGALALAGSLLMLGLAVLNERATTASYAGLSEASAGVNGVLDVTGGSADLVRALGMSEAFTAQFERARDRVNEPMLQAAYTTGRIQGLLRFFRLLLQSLALGLGAWLAVTHQISAGAIFASSMLVSRALSPVDQVVAQWRPISLAAAAYQRLSRALGNEPDRTYTQLPAPAARLAVSHVSVASPEPGRLLLRDISLAAEPGSVVGVIGPSGAGKTTLLQTIANVRPAEYGSLLIDGMRYTDWPADRLARHIGYMPQDYVLFPGTIKDNICRFDSWLEHGRLDTDMATVVAAQLAGAHEMILGLPKGYDTVIGAGGQGLSAGHRQRIALARAVYGDPVICVLDEPNSVLDADGEAALMNTIRALKARGRIVIFSAHRENMLAVTDHLAVLNGGLLQAFGTTEQVVRQLNAPRPAPSRDMIAASGV
ncbi:MAG: type I secretion system permease/ATPase [Caulobacteraceae bacterium]|nr:type I secretion system permease/ATPase [Caulobacteraceae bacterium]